MGSFPDHCNKASTTTKQVVIFLLGVGGESSLQTVKNAMSVERNKEKCSKVRSICTAPFAFSPTNPTHLK